MLSHLEASLKKEYQCWFNKQKGMAERVSQRYRRQRARSVVVIMIMMITTIFDTLVGHSNSLLTQATSKLTSPSAVQFVQGYRLEYVCRGFVQAHAWPVVSSATGPTECLKY
jgi:hypothetical protein